MEKFSAFYENLLRHSTKEQFAKRMIVIDGLNVLHSALNLGNEQHSVKSLLRFACFLPVVRFFVRRGHAVNIVIREQSSKFTSENFLVFNGLSKFRIVTEVPSILSDDVVALTIAHDNGGTVMSRDKFRDHMMMMGHLRGVADRRIEIHFRTREEFYENSSGDLFFKSDFEVHHRLRSDQVFAFVGEQDYDIVRRSQWSQDRCNEVLQMIDDLLNKLADGKPPLKLGIKHELSEDASTSDHSSSEEAEQAVAEFSSLPEQNMSWALAASAFAAPPKKDLIDFDKALDSLQGEFNQEEIDLAWKSVLPYERTLEGVRKRCESLQPSPSSSFIDELGSSQRSTEKKKPKQKKSQIVISRQAEVSADSPGTSNKSSASTSFRPLVKTCPDFESDLLDLEEDSEVKVRPSCTIDLLDSDVEDDLAWSRSCSLNRPSAIYEEEKNSLFTGHPHAKEKERLYNSMREELGLDEDVLYEVLYKARRLDRNQLINEYFDRLDYEDSNRNFLIPAHTRICCFAA